MIVSRRGAGEARPRFERLKDRSDFEALTTKSDEAVRPREKDTAVLRAEFTLEVTPDVDKNRRLQSDDIRYAFVDYDEGGYDAPVLLFDGVKQSRENVSISANRPNSRLYELLRRSRLRIVL